MKKTIIALLAAAIGAALLFAVFFPTTDISFPWSSTAVLEGNTPGMVKSAQKVGPINPNAKVKVVVGLKLRNEDQLDKLIAAQGDPSSPQYHQYLSPQDFSRQFAPTQADYDKVVAYLKSQGLTITDTASNRMVIGAEGTTKQVEKAFGVTISQYQWNGKLVFSNDADPRVPSSLGNIVNSVIGLNNVAKYHSLTVPGPKQTKNVPVGLTPPQVAKIYNYPNSNNPAARAKYDGQGHTIAIATAYNYSDQDVQDFWKQFGIKRTGTVTRVPIGGPAGTQLDDETTLDLEQIGSQVPAADVRMYLGVDPEFSTFTLIFNQIAVDNKADVVSVSWGACEKDTGAAQMKTEGTVFKELAAQGIVVFSAAGDDGAYDCQDDSGNKPLLSADYPASDPNVVAVGGTSLYLDGNGLRSDEIAWSGAGGAISSQYAQPQWQSGPGVPSNKKRNTSDVALVADPYTGYTYLFQGQWAQAGGTSFAAPNWGAQWIMVDAAAGKRIGNFNATIYRIARSADYSQVFYDVTRGNNGAGRGPGYNAGKGWDHPTGWGTDDCGKLVDAVLQEGHTAGKPTK